MTAATIASLIVLLLLAVRQRDAARAKLAIAEHLAAGFRAECLFQYGKRIEAEKSAEKLCAGFRQEALRNGELYHCGFERFYAAGYSRN